MSELLEEVLAVNSGGAGFDVAGERLQEATEAGRGAQARNRYTFR
jgi:hypothetical protein